ncbi:MAG: glycoside hydrolase family 65 protein [Defluviitaleaceae bacterium]|nr:glycoside hydrolase family 65 protein [Defluviitaleaceae bacterium]
MNNAKFPIHPWKITEIGFNPQHLAENESVFALANGYLGFRGNLEEDAPTGTRSIKGTYINGVYDTAPILYGESAYAFAKNSQTISHVAETKGFTIKADGEHVTFSQSLTNHVRELDLYTGILTRTFSYKTKKGGSIKVQIERLVSQENKHLAAMRLKITGISGGCDVEVTSGVYKPEFEIAKSDDPRTATGKDMNMILTTSGTFKPHYGAYTVLATKSSGMSVAAAITHQVTNAKATPTGESAWTFKGNTSQEIIVEKFATYYSGESKNFDAKQCRDEALSAADTQSYDTFAAQQKTFYKNFWDEVGMDIVGDDATLQGLRFNMFHLLQSTGQDGRTNIAAKGLTGSGYEGHYFWDTEIYVLPFMLHSSPQIAKALLMYRYSILDQARVRAKELGHDKGALYPWRTIGGEECSAYYAAGTAQYHINADIAYAIASYVRFTNDTEFLCNYGTEMLLETARLWYSLGFFNTEKGGKFCINHVTGPDEYNAVVNNNVYTNLMARENMLSAIRTLNDLQAKDPQKYTALKNKTNLSEEEIQDWDNASEAMYLPYRPDTQIFPQDEGFLDRKPMPIKDIPKENFPLLLHYHPLVIYRHNVCKQADLVLAMVLLGDYFTMEQKRENFHFYDAVTTHDSTLSKAVFSILASEIGEHQKAYDYFMFTARLDLDNTHKNTKDGLHMANMAGTWLCLVQGFAGMRCYGNTLSFAPHLPQGWESYTFNMHFQGRTIKVYVDKSGSKFSLVRGESIEILVDGKSITVHSQQ